MKSLLGFLKNLFRKLPDPNTIDRSGIVNSDIPYVNNGWIKGWAFDNPNRNVVVVCKHSNPRPGDNIFVKDGAGNKIIRTITHVDDRPMNGYEGLDIAVCKLDIPLPPTVKTYSIAIDLSSYQKCVTVDQYGVYSYCKLILNDKLSCVTGKSRKNELDPGDSGTPWFVWEDGTWKVCSHSFKGNYGIGPWYSNKKIYTELLSRLHQWD